MKVGRERTQKLMKLLNPASIAIVGASENDKKPGGRVIRYLAENNFAGAVYPINPRSPAIQGKQAFPSLEALPEVPDLVVVSVPAAAVNPVIASCNDLNVPAAIIFSSGFNEVGTPEGIALEAELKVQAGNRTLICGPNCQGIINFSTGCVANFSSALMGAAIKPGPVGIVSQSGLFAALIADSLKSRCGIGYIATTGNEIDVEFGDLVSVMADDPQIKVIVGYLEAIRDVERFKRAALRAREKGKPLVILKVGRTTEAAQAAKSHTGALSSPSFLYDSLFESLGIISVHDLAELTEASYLFSRPLSASGGTRLALLTNSGGVGVLCTDLLKSLGLELATLTTGTKANIQQEMRAFGSSDNPVDIATLAITDMPAVEKILESICDDPGVDIVVLILAFTHANADPLCQTVIQLAKTRNKPIIACWLSSDAAARNTLEENGIPVFDTPTAAFRAAAHLCAFDLEQAATHQSTDLTIAAPRLQQAKANIKRARDTGQTTLNEFDAMQMLEPLGIPVTQTIRVTRRDDVKSSFDRLDGPVVMKVDAKNILHKSDVGGVILSITSAAEAERAYDEILRNVAANRPGEIIDGVLMCQMVQDGFEMIVGGMRDPILGPYVMIGFGGIYAETLRDVVFRPAPVSRDQAGAMVRALKMFPLLSGARGREACDLTTLENAVAIVSTLLAEVDDIQEIDLNPVIVGHKKQGTVAVDALLTLS